MLCYTYRELLLLVQLEMPAFTPIIGTLCWYFHYRRIHLRNPQSKAHLLTSNSVMRPFYTNFTSFETITDDRSA